MYHVQQTCKCGQKYWPAQRWIHEKCGVINETATNTTTATNGNATNTSAGGVAVGLHQGVGDRRDGMEHRGGVEAEGARGGQERTKNRRSREAYNAYQREYMRKRRAKASSPAD